jgi:hypothetical protein
MHRVVTDFVEAEHAFYFGNEIWQFLSKFRISLGSLDKAQQFLLKLATQTADSQPSFLSQLCEYSPLCPKRSISAKRQRT